MQQHQNNLKTKNNMNKTLIIANILTLCLVSYAGTEHDDHDHDHSGHSHAQEAPKSKEHDHSDHDDHDHDAHAEKKAGPNGGRIITSVEPHFEFWVTPERTVQITFLDDHDKLIAPEGQAVSLMGGSRSNPTKLSFVQQNKVLLSNDKLPDGNNIPVILTIKTSPDAKTVRERLQVNMSECPTCDYREYACICDH